MSVGKNRRHRLSDETLKNRKTIGANSWTLRGFRDLRMIMTKRWGVCGVLGLLALLGLAGRAHAQDNYEIQVYGSETVAKGHTMFELHSNFIEQGNTTSTNGTIPTNHQLHETLEITHGFTEWFETGFYIFTSVQNGYGWDFVGSHIRPRVRVPPGWHWPVGVSISQEFGYQRAQFSADTWTYELRPIVDKQLGRWYFAFNPTFDKSFHGPSVSQGFIFSPDAKVSYDFTKKITGGIEYYGTLGPTQSLYPVAEQEQQIFPVIDLNVSPKWEINFGVGIGVTRSTDHLITKMILGYRFDF